MRLGLDIDVVGPVLYEGNWFDVEVSVLRNISGQGRKLQTPV